MRDHPDKVAIGIAGRAEISAEINEEAQEAAFLWNAASSQLLKPLLRG